MSFSPLSFAFSIAPRLPLHLVVRMMDTDASIAARRRGAMIDRLRANMTRLTGNEPSAHEMCDAVRSHIHNCAEQLIPGSCHGELLLKGVSFEGFEALATASKGGPIVLALRHSGSWDRVGAWVCAYGRNIMTVAKKVEPPTLFERFASLHEGLGMEIIDVAKSESVFSTLIERVYGRSVIVPLLADRDISGLGTEVDLRTRRVLITAGPAALVMRLERSPFIVCVAYENEAPTGADIHVRCAGPINADGREHPDLNHVKALTRTWVDEFAAVTATEVQDWHMMQRVYAEDLDSGRLARARAERGRKDR